MIAEVGTLVLSGNPEKEKFSYEVVLGCITEKWYDESRERTFYKINWVDGMFANEEYEDSDIKEYLDNIRYVMGRD